MQLSAIKYKYLTQLRVDSGEVHSGLVHLRFKSEQRALVYRLRLLEVFFLTPAHKQIDLPGDDEKGLITGIALAVEKLVLFKALEFSEEKQLKGYSEHLLLRAWRL